MFAARPSFRRLLPTASLALLAAGACSDSSAPNAGPVGLSFAARGDASTSGDATSTSNGTVVASGSDTLRLTRVRLVIDELELLRTTTGTCTDDSSSDDSSPDDSGHHSASSSECFEVETGPYLVDLPLNGNISSAITLAVPGGSYSKLEMKLRPADSGDDRSFIVAHPEVSNISVLAEGTYNGRPFTWRGSVRADLEMYFAQPMVVDGAGNITVNIDVGGWFRSGTGAIIDPATAGIGQVGFVTVAQNIGASFGAFEDDDHDGRDDHGGRRNDD